MIVSALLKKTVRNLEDRWSFSSMDEPDKFISIRNERVGLRDIFMNHCDINPDLGSDARGSRVAGIPKRTWTDNRLDTLSGAELCAKTWAPMDSSPTRRVEVVSLVIVSRSWGCTTSDPITMGSEKNSFRTILRPREGFLLSLAFCT